MASDTRVAAAVEMMATATNHRFFGEKEAATAIKVYADALAAYSNEAVSTAADEWTATMTKFPTLAEFTTLVRSVQDRVNRAIEAERRARALESGVGGMAPEQRYPVGKLGNEGTAAAIVIQRMIKAVGAAAPLGYFGRLAGLTDLKGAAVSAAELGHTRLGGGACARCDALATVAFEQVVEFRDSTVTWEAWETDGGEIDLGRLRRCANASCDNGWVSDLALDGERLKKCETCGGPRGAVPRPKVMDGEEMVPRTRRRR